MNGSEAPGSTGPSIAEYIRANRHQYTREALDDYLRRSGHADLDIAAAWVALDAEAPEHPPEAGAVMTTRQSVLSGLTILVAVAALIAGMFGIFLASGNRPAMFLYAILFPIQVILVSHWIYGRIRASSGLRAGDAAVTIGWLVVPPIVMLALIWICIGYTSAFGCVLHCS